MIDVLKQADRIEHFGFWEYSIVNDRLTWSNQIYKIFGKDQETFDVTLKSFLECVHPDDRSGVEKAYFASLENKTPYLIEHRITLDDGSIRFVQEKCETSFDKEGKPIRSMGTVQDITEKSEALRKLRDSEQKFQAISKQTTEGITVADMDGNYVYVNPAFCKMSGYSESELLELTVFDMKAPDQDHGSFKESKEKMEGQPIRVNLQRKDGTEYYTEIIGDIISIDDEQLVLGTIRDVSERVQHERHVESLNASLEQQVNERTAELNESVLALNEEISQRKSIEQELLRSVETKEILLKEITHRVKNNMQIISSIISLQKNNMNDDTCDFLDQIKHRIHSMALIHETLYKTNKFEEVQFLEYSNALLKYLQESFSTSSVEFRSDVVDSTLSLDLATNCGMIMMELIANAIKYAFPDDAKGVVEVTFKNPSENEYVLTVADNGVGFPKEVDFRKTSSLGLQVVVSLSEQIGGKIEQEVNNGTRYSITFNA